MPTITVLNQEGKALHELELAAEVFGIDPNPQAIFDTVLMQRASLRQGTHKVKNKREVAGGGRKPFRQKGTGRARAGSIRSPQWRGGGIVFGPTPRSHSFRINRKVRRLALKSVLSEKATANEIVVVDAFKIDTPKTKEFVKIQSALNLTSKTLYIFSAEENWENAYLSLRNLPNALFMTVEGINVYDLMNADKLVFTEAAVKLTGEVWA
ncbi:MAG: 50S ribosomal protein L4 [Firmicutes bacterium GWF2_51_9]|jgi:large subunit ribosomal protein L4|nr:MAG: 50S ribosomal protein L4 [Firmicutes bacterium GWF2_51_9]OGS58985.1 MAG: 50S ribosomal protein L4 [Firmicutes bacterium GWE2_51_13]HAM63998.1 50S ribosomal protein L4 [Erysipelotrichaceae bacterium]HBZ40561.1 50S ribosomal protein L4 [Erysipelotrichaceae bacterium]